MISSTWRGFALAATLLSSVAFASASLIFDRGLPTANLNNAAGSSRSNVAWGDAGGVFTGDDFQLGGSGQYSVSSIQTWVVGRDGVDFNSLYSGLTLWLGTGGNNPISATSFTFTATKVLYGDSSTYQSTSGESRDLWEIDWNTSGLLLNAGQLTNFGVSGTTTALGTSLFHTQDVVFSHASNAALSGSPQDGADGNIREWNPDGSFADNFDSNGNGWDKSSDTNVRVFGARVLTPEPVSMSLMGASAIGAFMRMRRRKKA